MSKKTFAIATDGSTVTFDLDISKSWQVTLAGNRTAVFAGGQEGDEVTILVIQDDTGGRTLAFPSNVSFETGVSPTLRSAAGASDLFTFVKKGSTWKSAVGAPSRLPNRVKDAGLTTMIAVGATALTLTLSGGGGQGTGNLPNAAEVRSKSGSELTTLIDGTGSIAIGSGKLIVGSVRDDASAKFRVLNDGSTTIKAAISGASLTIGASGDDANKAACWLSTGKLGKCGGADASACTCTAL